MQQIYRKYKERFIEISGKNRSLFTKTIIKKYNFDLGALLEYVNIDEFYDFLWHRQEAFTIINEKIAEKNAKAMLKNNLEESNSEAEILKNNISDLKYLKREVDDIQTETGRYDLNVGFPYVFGKISQDLPLKAPLLLFPVQLEIDRDTAILSHVPNQAVVINKSLVLAFCKEHHRKTDNIITEFDPNNDEIFHSPYDVVEYLNDLGLKIKNTKRKSIGKFDRTKEIKNEDLELKNLAVLGRFPLANPIYDDYIALEKDNLSSPSIDLLLSGKQKKEKKSFHTPITYTVNDLDYAQENAIEKINDSSNIVIYGPPGTGKSQTIVNIISDSLCKNRRILVVSQKQAALDVVFSRLGKLNSKAMLIPDPEKDKIAFFNRLKESHAQAICGDPSDNQKKYKTYESNINKEISVLESISEALFTKTEFGLTLQEMFAQSYIVGKDTKDYRLYTELQKTDIISRNYQPLNDDLRYIFDKKIAELYVKRMELTDKNPMVEHIKEDLDIHGLRQAHVFLKKLLSDNFPPFNFSIYPHSRYLIPFYFEQLANSRQELKKVASTITKMERPDLTSVLYASIFPVLWPAFPFLRYRYVKYRNDVNIDLNVALKGMSEYEKPFLLLQNVLDDEGYALAISGIFNGNYFYLKSIVEALENYVPIRDMNKAINELSDEIKALLDFAYQYSDRSLHDLQSNLEKIMPLRIYHEIIKSDVYFEDKLSQTVNFDNVRKRILKLKAEQREISKSLAMDKFSTEYLNYFDKSPASKDYLFQTQKQRGLWPIRRMIEYFSEFLFRLFPCWLLSPQTVSTIFPLKRGMFDLIVFDEASQMFIENAIPTIYRGNNIVVAGDNKQLRPSSGFIKRSQADESFDNNVDLPTQAALEVESLLDLATSKYAPVNLVYHYRSNYAELIDFSNIVFYENKLQIAPNVNVSIKDPPIERIKVKGTWQNRHNHEEALAVIKLIHNILNERKDNESIGIVTFNVEQKEYIEDLLDSEAEKIASFRRQLFAERNRIECGENRSLFVKNLENVQGDERDIIIFSIGYAKNAHDKVMAQFGSLSQEGGENRLNVAITRAKKKIYIVTSIEPEELDKAETTKNEGPKLLKKYLQYARAVSFGDRVEIKKILSTFASVPKPISSKSSYEDQIKSGLEKMGYKVFSDIGNTYSKLSLGVYDEKLGKFILGIECDYQAHGSGESVLERDVYRIKFLESRGWKIVRVWSRDWWLSHKQVLDNLAFIIEKERKKALNNT